VILTEQTVILTEQKESAMPLVNDKFQVEGFGALVNRIVDEF
jgi:hypothetical protein